jgi:hypothetical protein
MGTRGSFPGVKSAGAWSWPLHFTNTSSWRGAQLKGTQGHFTFNLYRSRIILPTVHRSHQWSLPFRVLYMIFISPMHAVPTLSDLQHSAFFTLEESLWIQLVMLNHALPLFVLTAHVSYEDTCNTYTHTVKLKVKLSLCLTKHHAMKTSWGVKVWLHAFLTSTVGGSEWSASRPGCFTPGKRAPERLRGPQSRYGCCSEKIFSLAGYRTPVVQPVAYSLYWLNYKGEVDACFNFLSRHLSE